VTKLRQWVIISLGAVGAVAIMAFVNLVVPSPFHRPVLIEPGKSMPIPGDPLAALNAKQRVVLASWLAENDQYGIIEVYYCDFQTRRSSCESRLIDDHPYLAVGDFNADGHGDFAIILQVRESNPLRAYLAIFNGPHESVNGEYAPALLVEDEDFMRLGDDLFASTVNGRTRLFLGPLESDNGYLIVPRGNIYSLEYNGSPFSEEKQP
jgi:hypothetical protein